jgi:hypothetical protein
MTKKVARARLAELGYDIDEIIESINEQEEYEGTKQFCIGTVFGVFPSGKYWCALGGNASEEEKDKDMAWREEMDELLSVFGVWIEQGENDPCDVYFCKSV